MTVSIHALQHPDTPEVQKALEIPCGLCGVPVGHFCHAVGIGKKMATLVHFERATRHQESKGKKS